MQAWMQAIVLSMLAATTDGNQLRPTWPPNFAMNASIYSGYLNADYTGLADTTRAAAIARHGLITLSWMQDICHNSRNTTPPTCRYAHAEDSLQQQVIALKRINPAARVFVYRNCALGLSTYGNSCAKMYGEATANWWLRVGDVKTAAVLNDPIDPTAGVRADRTAFSCEKKAWQPGQHLQDQYLWDYRLPQVQQFLVDDLTRLVGGGEGSPDGIWLDDTHAFNEHSELEKGYSRDSIAKIGGGLQRAAVRAQQVLLSMGKWVYHFDSSVEIPLVQGDRAKCETSLLSANNSQATQNMFGTMQLPIFLANESSANHNFRQNLAAFLLTRGNYSFFGAVGPGDGAVFSPLSGSRWFAEYDWDYGVPMSGMRVVRPGVYSREWSSVTVLLDCNAFVADFHWKVNSPQT